MKVPDVTLLSFIGDCATVVITFAQQKYINAVVVCGGGLSPSYQFDFFSTDGWKKGKIDGRIVPRRIMVFVFRLCPLGIILPSLWRENLTLRILFQLSRKMIKGRSPGQIFGES